MAAAAAAGGPRLNMPCIDLSTERLRFYRQIGAEEVTLAVTAGGGGESDPTARVRGRPVRPLVPPAQTSAAGGPGEPWDEEALREMVARCASFGLEATTMNLGLSGPILNGQAQREQDVEVCAANIRTAGRVGLRVLTWNFTALRASEGYGAKRFAGRGRSDLRDFDARRLSAEPLPDCPACTHDDMWARLQWTLERLVPVAEESGVLLALHPTDPPVPVYRGVSQICINFEEIKRFIAMYDSPSNTFFMDTGVATEWGREPAEEVIEYFGSRQRIGMVHFRNVVVVSPPAPAAPGQGQIHYIETFIDEGDADMAACMSALVRNGYAGGVDPDHTPHLLDDETDTPLGWTLCLGYIAALRDVYCAAAADAADAAAGGRQGTARL